MPVTRAAKPALTDRRCRWFQSLGVLFTTSVLVSDTPMPQQVEMPPPVVPAELSETVLFLMVSEPPQQPKMPPPSLSV